jgi:hypothetical protein
LKGLPCQSQEKRVADRRGSRVHPPAARRNSRLLAPSGSPTTSGHGSFLRSAHRNPLPPRLCL